MPARILKTDTQDNLQSAIQAAARVILTGGVVAVPTESFYGLAVHALNDKLITSRVGREETPSPSSNRTCGFPASGFPEDFRLRHTQ